MAFKKLKVKVGQVTGTHTNFPTLIQPSLITGLGSITLAEAQSARFYSDVGKTTEIAREIVSADEIHVKVTSMEALAEIWMDYDGIRSDYAVTATYGRNAVWSDYEFVNHYETSTTNIPNSTGGANGTASGSITTGTAQKIGEGIDNTSGIIIASYTSPSNTSRQFSKTIWFKTTETDAGSIILSATSDGGPDNQIFFFERKLGFRCMGGTGVTVGSINQYRDGNWHKATLIKTGASTAEGRVNGAFVTSVNVGSYDRADAMWTGGRPQGNNFDGQFDEFKYRESSVSSSYDEAEYNNQNANGSFWEATDAGGGGSTPAQAARRGVIMMM